MKAMKLKKRTGTGVSGKKPITIGDILPYLPKQDCFFDTRHWVVGINIIPFAITTKIAANHQQFLKRYKRIRQASKSYSKPICNGGVFDNAYPQSNTRRGRVQGGGKICPTITSAGAQNIIHLFKDEGGEYLFRRLTERECFRLQGVPEEYIDRIQETGMSGSRQYFLAGNSICVDVLAGIFSSLINGCEKPKDHLF